MTNDNVVKYVALGFLAFLAVASVVVYGYDTIVGIPPPAIIASIIAAAVGYALHALGVQAGSVTTLNGVHAEAQREAASNAYALSVKEATRNGFSEGQKEANGHPSQVAGETGGGIPMGPAQQ